MRQLISRCLVLLSVVAATYCSASRPWFVDCQASQECGKGGCCSIGYQRFSIPTCRALGELGDYCRPDSEPFTGTLSWPNGDAVEVVDLYRPFCPCRTGLVCSRDTRLCVENEPSNHLDDFA